MDAEYLKSLPYRKSYSDRNGNVHTPRGDVFVVDDSGNLVASSVPPRPPRPLKRSANEPSNDDLSRLKGAIIADGDCSYQKQLSQATSLIRRMSWSGEDHEMNALRWCWDVLYWRPSAKGDKVRKKHPNNVYMK